MKRFTIALALFLFPMILGCGGVEPQPGSTDEAARICPLYVPLCQAPCKLSGPCNNQCHCPNNVIQCGTTTCNASTEVCCIGAINTYTCVKGNVCIF